MRLCFSSGVSRVASPDALLSFAIFCADSYARSCNFTFAICKIRVNAPGYSEADTDAHICCRTPSAVRCRNEKGKCRDYDE